jgi:hypothetical protein
MLHIRRYLVRSLLGLFVVIVIGSFCRPWEETRGQARNAQCKNNLKQIGLALHLYHDDWGSFPPAYVADESGKPSYGWRTLILPYLDKLPLYNAYRFDEPADGPNNSEHRDKGMPVLHCPASLHHFQGQTNYLAVVGPGTAWPGSRPANLKKDFPDGASRTILVVEVENSGVHWMDPRDLNFDEISFALNDPTRPSISSGHTVTGNWPWSGTFAVVNVLFADGTVARLPADTPPETIRAWLTANGGENVSPPP